MRTDSSSSIMQTACNALALAWLARGSQPDQIRACLRTKVARKVQNEKTYLSLPEKYGVSRLGLAASCRHFARDTKQLCHADKISERSCAHFPHDVAAVNLHRDLAYPDLAGHLLVHQSGRDQGHDLQLARREGLELGLERRH